MSIKISNFSWIAEEKMIDKMSGFGERLEKVMKSRNISNIEITRALGLNKNAIGNYKKDQIPNATILYNLSNFLGISMEYLIAGKEAADLSPEEQKLVDCYRSANDQGKRTIMGVAELQRQELGSSASQIGLTGTGES